MGVTEVSGDRERPRVEGRLHAGDVIAEKYVIDSELGAGGMGVVYAATNLFTHKRVAIKWMLARFGQTPDAVARFLREARAAGRIDHPNVINVFDVGREKETPFLVMEILSGAPLSAVIARAPLAPATVVELLMPAMRGIAAAHAVGVVHRDLKPDNVFLCADASGRAVSAKVLDFGISKLSSAESEARVLTQTGAIMGTPQYMSPEQIRGMNDIDERSDVYAVGAMLYEALTGRPPFSEEMFTALAVAIATGTLVPPRDVVPSIDPGLDAVVVRALARDRAQRWQDVASLARALEPFGAGAKFADVGGAIHADVDVRGGGSLALTVDASARGAGDDASAPAGKVATGPMVVPHDALTRDALQTRSVDVSVSGLGRPRPLRRWPVAAAAAVLVLVAIVIAATTIGRGSPDEERAEAPRVSRRAAVPPSADAPVTLEPRPAPEAIAETTPAEREDPPAEVPVEAAPTPTREDAVRVVRARREPRPSSEAAPPEAATTASEPTRGRATGVRTGGVSVDDF